MCLVHQKIKKANGKLVGEKRKEGDHGMIQEFEDTEGNLCATYAMVNKEACPREWKGFEPKMMPRGLHEAILK